MATQYGLTHGTLVTGTVETIALEKARVVVAKFEMFSYYHIQLMDSSSCCFHIQGQQRPEIRLVYVLKGSSMHMNTSDTDKSIVAGESNCLFVPEGLEQEITVDSDCKSEMVIAITGLADFTALVAGDRSFDCNIAESCSSIWQLDSHNLPFRPEQYAVLDQLIQLKKPGYLRRSYLQIKLAELFVLFMEQSGQFAGERKEIKVLRPEELDRIRRVRDMLYERPAESYSLVGLAHAVGTNEASLKKHFKAVYGTTVFGYLTACRMERAKALLVNENLKVALVAQEVGYKYASHFSAAFRKYFGYLPTKLLRVIISISTCLQGGDYEMVWPSFMVL